VEDLFHAVLQLPPEDRAAFLARDCSDADLRREVEELVAAHDDSDTRLDSAFDALTETLGEASAPGKQIGPFQIERIIASGGMGTVYEAVQGTPKRSVALKLMRLGFESPSAVRRFEYESQILARLHHPGIAHVYESGTLQEGTTLRPWFAMELIPSARSITGFARDESLDVGGCIRLVVEAAHAVHHGHQKGVVHRDLKPANVLVDSDGRVKIIDFGVAKALDAELEPSTLQTAADQVVGTPRYMSPEQAQGGQQAVDTRTDVHALGVMLYELLTRQLPYDVEGQGIVDALAHIRERPPDEKPLREVGLPEDLRVIVLKAIEKDVSRRYDSAMAMADDLQRFLADQPVHARPPSAVYQLRKFARRNRVLVASTAAVVAALSIGVVGATYGLLEAQQQRHQAEQRRVEAEAARDDAMWGREYLASIFRNADPWEEGGRQLTMEDVLDHAVKRLDAEPPESAQTQGEMRWIIGDMYRKVASLERSEQQLRMAVDALSEDDTLGVDARLALANTLFRRDKLDEAQALTARVVELRRERLGDDDPQTLAATDQWARIIADQGKVDEGIETLKEVVERLQTKLGANDKRVVTAKNNLASVHYRKGDYGPAIDGFTEVMEYRERELGPEHPDTLTVTGNLAAVYAHEERWEESDALYKKTLAISRGALGNRHWLTLQHISNYAGMLRQWDKVDRAEPLSREAYEGRRVVLGDGHSDTLQSLSNYAVVLDQLERYDDAEELYERGIEAAGRRPEETARKVISMRSNYASLLQKRQRLEDAEDQFRQATEQAHQVLGADNWLAWGIQSNYGGVLIELRRYDDARLKLEEAYRRLLALRGPDNGYTKKARTRLERVYESLGKSDVEEAIRVAAVGG
jgi:non-specific serine/threonine protein kinase/serine/threonine-protein kinase